MSESPTIRLQHCLDRLQAGDTSARKELLNSACERLGQLTRTMLRDYRRLKRWEETDDVLQNALMRLYRALDKVTPATLRDFYRLAALQIRRELIDLARHYYGPEGGGGKHQSVCTESTSSDSHSPPYDQAGMTQSPDRLAVWGEFHEQVNALPEEEREVFDMLWYQGLSHSEAAELLGVATKTVQRRWHAACRRLHAALGGELPGI